MKYSIILIFLLSLVYCNPGGHSRKGFLLAGLVKDWSIHTYFSHPGRFSPSSKKYKVQRAILNRMGGAKDRIDIFAYGFTDQRILDALQAAKKNGVEIHFVGDTNTKYSGTLQSISDFRIWKKSGIHHVKVIICDDRWVFLGTGNFTHQGLNQDFNGFLEFQLKPGIGKRFRKMMDDEWTPTAFRVRGMEFINSPRRGKQIQSRMMRSVRNAKNTVDFLIFSDYDSILTHELRKASGRGVEVTGVFNRPMSPQGKVLRDHFHGIISSVSEDRNQDRTDNGKFGLGGLLHHKTLIVDRELLLTGSYNFSKNARDNNREIQLRTEIPGIVSAFEKDFQRILKRSQREKPKSWQNGWQKRSGIYWKGDHFCLPEPVHHHVVVELGSGVFSTDVYYPAYYGQKCFSKMEYDSISTTFASTKTDSILHSKEFWKSMKVYPDWSDRVYTKKENSWFASPKILEPSHGNIFTKDPYRMDLESNPESIQGIAWIQGESVYHFTAVREGTYWKMPSVPKGNYGVFFWKENGMSQFLCFSTMGHRKTQLEEFLREYQVYFGRSKPTCSLLPDI